MTGDEGPSDFHKVLERLGAATYSPHRFDFAIDVNPLVDALSPTASAFFFEETANRQANGGISPERLYERRWQDDPEILSEFLELDETAQVEALTLYTVPLHESRHHIDFLTTPFGVRFYSLLRRNIWRSRRAPPSCWRTRKSSLLAQSANWLIA
jgi:hypothetical protein